MLLRSNDPLPNASKALRFLQSSNVPFILLTNGGGLTEAKRVEVLSEKLEVPLDVSMFVQSHTPFAEMEQYKKKTVLVVGGDGDNCRHVAENYGYTSVVMPGDLYAAYPDLWPFSKQQLDFYRSVARPLPRPIDPEDPGNSLKIDAIFVFNDPRDWGLDATIILDVLLSRQGILGTFSEKNGNVDLPNHGYLQDGQPALYYANPDLWWAAKWHLPRLGQGGFREAMEGIWDAVTGGEEKGIELKKTIIGKPYHETYAFAEKKLKRHRDYLLRTKAVDGVLQPLQTVYMIGDNPESDIRGANNYRSPDGTKWESILVQTGVWQPGKPLPVEPSRIENGVLGAVRWACRNEGWTGSLPAPGD